MKREREGREICIQRRRNCKLPAVTGSLTGSSKANGGHGIQLVEDANKSLTRLVCDGSFDSLRFMALLYLRFHESGLTGGLVAILVCG